MARIIVRRPTRSYTRAMNAWFQQAHPEGASIDVDRARAQHAAYVTTLRSFGHDVTELLPDERYPDGCFVQDPVLVQDDAALVLNMHAETRRGEGDAFRGLLPDLLSDVTEMRRGHCDGGDVMVMADIGKVMVGLSKRTDREGFEAVRDFYSRVGMETEPVPVERCLHLSTGASYLKDGVVLGSDKIDAAPFTERGFTYLQVPDEEAYAANVLTIGDVAIVAAGYPRTAKIVREHGFDVAEVPLSEFAKADGSVTCLSKPL